MTCGCGIKLEFEFYLVYADEQPHCRQCFEDAIDCTVLVPVRKIDAHEYRKEMESAA